MRITATLLLILAPGTVAADNKKPADDAPAMIAPEPSRTQYLNLAVSAGPMLTLATTASTGFAFAADVRGTWIGRTSLAIGGRYYVPTTTSIEPDGEVEVSLAVAEVRPCVHAWVAEGCVVFVLGAMPKSSTTPEGNRIEATDFYSAIGLRVGAELDIWWRLRLRGSFEMLAPFSKQSINGRKTAVNKDGETIVRENVGVWGTSVFGVGFGVSLVANLY